MSAKRIIPCLDVDKGRVVKGIHFVNIRDAGDPVELASYYDKERADELVFLDITASSDKRRTVIDLASKVAEQVFIPYTVGGGISNINDIRMILEAGADKVSLNTQAVKNPDLVSEASMLFGSQCVVLAIDARKSGKHWEVFINGGRIPTEKDAVKWAVEGEKLGAGEILLTSMDRDGTKNGYDIDLTYAVAASVNIPVIASGGAGNLEHLSDVILKAGADAVLVASIFHYGTYTIREAKKYLISRGIEVRL